MIRVREATIEDLPWMVSEGTKFLNFYFPKQKVDAGHIYIVMYRIVKGGLLLVSEEEDGDRTGFIGGLITKNIYYPEENDLYEMFWWVVDGYRRGRSSLMLLKEFVNRGKEMGADKIVMTLLSISPVNKDALIKRGFELKESAFVMEV